jgi:hypothetical protein
MFIDVDVFVEGLWVTCEPRLGMNLNRHLYMEKV